MPDALTFTDAALTVSFSDGRTRELSRDELLAVVLGLGLVVPSMGPTFAKRAPAAESVLRFLWPELFDGDGG